MARFGIEGIRHFGHARAAGVSTAGDLTTRSIAVTVSITSPSQRSIPEPSTGAKRIAGKQTVCDADQGGDDIHWVDDVDIFWIETHENHEADGEPGCFTTRRRPTGVLIQTNGSSARTGTPNRLWRIRAGQSTSTTSPACGTSLQGFTSTAALGRTCPTGPGPGRGERIGKLRQIPKGLLDAVAWLKCEAVHRQRSCL